MARRRCAGILLSSRNGEMAASAGPVSKRGRRALSKLQELAIFAAYPTGERRGPARIAGVPDLPDGAIYSEPYFL